MRKALAAWMAAISAVALAGVTSTAPAQDASTQPTGLPDLVMQPITQVKAWPMLNNTSHKLKRRWAVRFTSTVVNQGPGHFVIHGHRPATGTPCSPQITSTNKCEKRQMVADQLIFNADGTTTTVPAIGKLYFDQQHFHWHFRGVSHYQLRSANGRRVLARDHKTGFCFGDRFALKYDPKPPEYTPLEDGLATCLYGSTSDPSQDGRRALEVTEGISAGFGDDYRSFNHGLPLQGQQLEVTKLKAGRYLLVNRTNATGKIQEVTKANDVSSVLFSLRWPHGRHKKPAVKVLASCPAAAVCTVAKAQAQPPVSAGR